LGRNDILIILSLLTHKQGISLHLFQPSDISLNTISLFLVFRQFTSFGQISPSVFNIVDVIVNGTFKNILISSCSLVVYRDAVDFCVLILYLGASRNSLTNSSHFSYIP
jgi:hypothetical protein